MYWSVRECAEITVATIDPLLDWFGPDESRVEKLLYEAADALGAPPLGLLVCRRLCGRPHRPGRARSLLRGE